MKQALLLRSYGDFVIALYHLPPHPKAGEDIRIMASTHLQDLHKALFPFLSPAQQSIQFVDLNIRHRIFAGFTDRHFFSVSHAKELTELRKFLSTRDAANTAPAVSARDVLTKDLPVYLEQQRRSRWLRFATGRPLLTVHSKGNIYDSWAAFYGSDHAAKKAIHFSIPTAANKLLIFPDSRLKRKEIPEQVLRSLEEKLKQQGKQVERAYFNRATATGSTSYHQFDELVALIYNADFIISSDSLPAHIAQLLGKPHAILYAQNINEEWVTPFAREQRLAFTFDEATKINL